MIGYKNVKRILRIMEGVNLGEVCTQDWVSVLAVDVVIKAHWMGDMFAEVLKTGTFLQIALWVRERKLFRAYALLNLALCLDDWSS